MVCVTAKGNRTINSLLPFDCCRDHSSPISPQLSVASFELPCYTDSTSKSRTVFFQKGSICPPDAFMYQDQSFHGFSAGKRKFDGITNHTGRECCRRYLVC